MSRNSKITDIATYRTQQKLYIKNLNCVQVCTAVGLVRVVLAVIVPITNVGRVGADAGATLELTRPAFKLSYNEKTKHMITLKKY